MKTRFTVEALALVGMAAGLAVTSGCRTTYSDNADLSLTPMPASLEPEAVGNVTYPTAEAEKTRPYWQQHPEAVAALDKPAATSAAAKAGANYSTYVVKPGDNLSKIAAARGFRTADVVAVNPGLNPNKIRVGQAIVLPDASVARPAAPKSGSAKAAAPRASSASDGTYIVKKGDILGRIAIRHGVKVSDLKKANGLASDRIAIGQKLVIPGAKSTATSQDAAVVPPKDPAPVQPKATPSAALPEVKPAPQAAIAPAVKEVAPPTIVAPPPTTVAPPAVEVKAPVVKGRPYIVQEGQDLYDISVQWGVSSSEIKALNNLKSDAVSPGQTLLIPAPRAE